MWQDGVELAASVHYLARSSSEVEDFLRLGPGYLIMVCLRKALQGLADAEYLVLSLAASKVLRVLWSYTEYLLWIRLEERHQNIEGRYHCLNLY